MDYDGVNGKGNTTMESHAAAVLARRLMNEHLAGQGWSFEWDRAKRRFGACHTATKRITLSHTLVLLNDEDEVRNTILHEIAHALAGAKAGHGPVWRAQARAIGCDAKRCYSDTKVTTPTGRYKAVCPGCGKEHYMHRRTRTPKSCGKCSRRFDPRFLLEYRQISY
jgi:predicted SprT family Zn-dependent metalloprotease